MGTFSQDENWDEVKANHRIEFLEHVFKELWAKRPNSVISAVNLYQRRTDHVIPDEYQLYFFKQAKQEIRYVTRRFRRNDLPPFVKE